MYLFGGTAAVSATLATSALLHEQENEPITPALTTSASLDDSNSALSTDCNVYQLDTDAWTWSVLHPPSGARCPSARSWHTLVYDSDSDALLVYGGRNASGDAQADLWRFDLGNQTWTCLWTPASSDGPQARFDHAATILGKHSV